MFRVPRTDFYIACSRNGYQVLFRTPDKSVAGGFREHFLWQFAALDILFRQLPTQIDGFMRSSREADKPMKAQKKQLIDWLITTGAQAIPRIVRARGILRDTIRNRQTENPNPQGENVFGTDLIIRPAERGGFEIVRPRLFKPGEDFIWHFRKLDMLYEHLPLLLSEEPFRWQDVGAKDTVSQYETCVNWTRFQINPATINATPLVSKELAQPTQSAGKEPKIRRKARKSAAA